MDGIFPFAFHFAPLKPMLNFESVNTRKDTSTKINEDGLRYKSKVAGTMFESGNGYGTMSCFRCGTHKARSSLVSKKILGRNHLVCAEKCK